MRYLTKEWYNKMQQSSLYVGLKFSKEAEEFSESYYKKLYNKEKTKYVKSELEFTNFENFKKDLLEIYEIKNITDEEIEKKLKQYKEESYNGMKIEDWFDECQKFTIEKIKTTYPKEILDNVKDIRVLALGYVSKKTYKLIKEYSETNQKFTDDRIREYYEMEEEQFKNKKIDFLNHYFHDSFIEDIIKDEKDLIINLDTEFGVTNKQKIILKNYKILLDENIKETHWLYNEVYKNEDKYEIHILTSINDDLRELILECENIIIK